MILIVDDNNENIFSLKSLLTLHHFEVDSATSGEEALKKIIQNAYSLIILDVQMPEMDGFEVAEAISGYSKSKDIPIIFLSAVNIHKKFITKGYTSGGMDYITKPFDPEILLLKIKTFYRLSEQTRQLNELQQSLRTEIEIRKRAEAKLQYSFEELKSILESIPQIAFTTSSDGKVDYVNNFWFQYSPDKNMFPQTEGLSVDHCIREGIQQEKQVIREIKIKDLKTGEFLFHVLYLTPVLAEGNVTRWVGIFTNIHEQRMLNKVLEKKVDERTSELKRINERLEISNNELSQFAFVASHDLQEPLRKIQTFSNLIIDRYLPEDQRATPYLEKISSSADRLRKLIIDLLNYANINGENRFQPTDMNALIQETLMDLELKIKSQNSQIEVGDFPELEVIPSQMSQVFQNLVSNSIKFSKEGEPAHIKISAELIGEKSFNSRTSANGKFCRIVIEDNGIGFSNKYADRIFEIFQRLNAHGVYEGTGIGLAIVKRVIDRHEGVITVSSRENEGTKFIIVIPIKQQL